MMTNTRAKILLVDDERPVLEMLADLFSDDYDAVCAASGPEAIEAAGIHSDIAVVVMDIKMARMDGITAARQIRTLRPDLAIIFHTGYPGEYEEQSIDAAEKPFDYVQKGNTIDRLLRSVRNAVEAYRLRQDNRLLSDLAAADYGIIGRSAPMQEVFRTIRKVAPTDSKVMILGETGTGKELVARAIHAHSRRGRRRMGILNCNHKSPDLIESELFGHIKGAFTGAVQDRIGLFEYAEGGTVFLDEIGDLDITTQAKLLRVLETGEFQKVGTPSFCQCDARLICATHHDLAKLVAQGRFREDLFYRLKGVAIVMPPLRNRREDIPLLLDAFCAASVAELDIPPRVFDTGAIQVLLMHDWPGNVRQLQDTVRSLVTLADSQIIFAEDVRQYLGSATVDCDDVSPSLPDRLRNIERTLILGALAETRYNITTAARILGIDRSTLQKKIKAHALDLNRPKP